VTLPRVQPIIPTRRKEPFDDPDWLFDFKYDGFRAVCYLDQGRCRFISRNGNVLSRFEALGDQVGRLLDVGEAIIDGEVIAVDESGRPQFYELLRAAERQLRGFRHPLAQRHQPARFAAQRAPPAVAEHSAEGVADRFRGAIGRGQGA
jgi:ATP-dependent DNA ligase